jgi:hypothetical protein
MNRAHYTVLIGLASAALAGCSPKIGSRCNTNADCGSSGALVCDTSQPYGYCTEFNCTPGACQDRAACVEFLPSVPGCPYDDYRSPSRTGVVFCMEHCNQDSDCRQSDGYVCRNPSGPPWHAAITDNNQSQLVCIVAPDPAANLSQADSGFAALPDGSVCSPSGPAVPPIEAGTAAADAGADSAEGDGGHEGGDAAIDAGADAGTEAGFDAGIPAGSEDAAVDDGAADAGGPDASSDSAPDAGAPDAQGGG